MSSHYGIEFNIDEIYLIKLTTEKMLAKFATIIKDLVDCNNIFSKICLEGLNGFLVVENEELILYSIYRYVVRDGAHNLNEGDFYRFLNIYLFYNIN